MYSICYLCGKPHGNKVGCNPRVLAGIDGAHKKAANEETFLEYDAPPVNEALRLWSGLLKLELMEK